MTNTFVPSASFIELLDEEVRKAVQRARLAKMARAA